MEMVDDIKKSFLDILHEIDWMDSTTKYGEHIGRYTSSERLKYLMVTRRSYLCLLFIIATTRERARDKANTMQTHIGYPVELLNNTKLVELYDGVSWETSRDSHLKYSS